MIVRFKESRNLFSLQKEATEKQLASLKAVTKSLEDYKIDPVKLAEWNISVKIADLEKEVSDLNKAVQEKKILKRKTDANESQGLKHPRTSNGVSPQIHSNLISNEQRAFGLTSGQTIYGGGQLGHINGYTGVSPLTAPSLLGAYGTGAVNMTFPGNLAGPGFGHAASTGGLSHDERVHLPRYGTGSYLLHGDGSMGDDLSAHIFTRPPAFQDRGFLGSASAMEQGFSGQPSTSRGFGNRSTGADLYQFADAVMEGGSYNSSRTGNSYMASADAHLNR